MIKLIYSNAFDSTVDVRMRVMEDPALLTKAASNIFGVPYEALKADKDHLGIHVVALGDFEHYGLNRNFDGFPKVACQKYHHTFVKNGAVFQHHRNKDREKNLGTIKASGYNDAMGRIELFIHAHKERARDHLQRLEKEGEVPFSMACRVAFDRCTRPECGRLRKNASDPNQCDHIKHAFGQMGDDGIVNGTHNDEPDYFDISFVGRPADRIAWNLKLAAGETVSAIKLAEYEGIWVPDHVAIASASGLTKLDLMRKMAAFEAAYRKVAAVGEPVGRRDRYFWELRKAADATVDDATLTKLREYEPRDVFTALAKVGVVLTPDAFYKYAFGSAASGIEDEIKGAVRYSGQVFSNLVKQGECQTVCNDTTFDINPDVFGYNRSRKLPEDLLNKAAEQASVLQPFSLDRVIQVTVEQRPLKMAFDTNTKLGLNIGKTMVVLAEKYAAYKLAAVEAILSFHGDTDRDAVLAIAAAQNLM